VSLRCNAALLLALTLVSSAALANTKIVRRASAMGTGVTLTIWGNDEVKAARAASAAFAELNRVDTVMSSWLGTSDVSIINASEPGSAVHVGDEVFSVIELAIDAAKKTGGAFDITVGGFRGLWKFDEDLDKSIPTAAEIKKRVALVDWRQIRLDSKAKTVSLAKPGMRITLGGIAKGHAVDRAVKLLRDRGIKDFILQAGGDLYVSGSKGPKPWTVGIRDPRGPREDVPFASVSIADATFSTSGDYERGFVKNGVRYHHILDPETGRPAKRSRSVTVLAKRAVTADIWSTALFVIGHKRGLKLVESMPNIEAVFVDPANKVHISSGLEGKLVIHHPPTAGI